MDKHVGARAGKFERNRFAYAARGTGDYRLASRKIRKWDFNWGSQKGDPSEERPLCRGARPPSPYFLPGSAFAVAASSGT
jgi:hypothetical protein